MQYILHSVLYHEEQTASNTVGEQNRQNRQNKQNRTAYKSGGTRVRARRRRFKERSDRATPPGARAATERSYSSNIPTSNILTPSSRYLEHFANGLQKFLQLTSEWLTITFCKRFCKRVYVVYRLPRSFLVCVCVCVCVH